MGRASHGTVSAIRTLLMAVLDFVGDRYDWVKEEINSKPKKDVI
jgi:hypothetical protein